MTFSCNARLGFPEWSQPRNRRLGGVTGDSRPRSGASISAHASLRAAINEFSARGYHRTSVEDIVRSARTSRTAFYAFFDNREDAMYGALQASFHGAARRGAEGDGRRQTDSSLIEVGVTAYVDFLVHGSARRRASSCSRASAPHPRSTRIEATSAARCRRIVRDIWAAVRPRARRRLHMPQRSRSACSASCWSRCCTSWRASRLDEAPAHVPALVTAAERILAPAN